MTHKNPVDVLISKIKMKNISKDNQVIILVEGDSDSRFYKNYFHKKICKIKFPMGGNNNKANAIKTLEKLTEEDYKVIALLDADFDHLEKKKLLYDTLFLTDTHDLETMILSTNALEKIINESDNSNKLAEMKEPIVQILLRTGKWIGYIRWFNKQENYALKFSSLDYGKFIKLGSAQIDIDLNKLVDNIKNKSTRPDIKNNDFIEQIKQLFDKSYDLWQVCNGHDLVKILFFILFKQNGKDNVIADFEKNIRLSYETNQFLKTKLYQSIFIWEKENELEILAIK